VQYSYFKVRFDDSDTFSAPLSRVMASLNERKLHAFEPTVDLAFGIQWQSCIRDCMDFTIKLGFEHHEYFNQSHLGSHNGNYSLDGGALSFIVEL
jgi:hypothetical protein